MTATKGSAPNIQRLEKAVAANGKLVKRVVARLDRQNLNGSIAALHALAEASPSLLMLAKATPSLLAIAEAAPMLIAEVDQQKDREAFWRGFKVILHPFRPLGAVVWFVVLAATTAAIWNLVDRVIAITHGQP